MSSKKKEAQKLKEKLKKKKEKQKPEVIISSDESEKANESEEEDDKMKKNCQKCREKKANCLFIPCGHCNYCWTCAEEVYKMMKKKCSLCFMKIEFLKFKD